MVRVLVVDDDAAVLKFIAQILRSEAIEPIIAPDEETALAAVAKAPDAVVLDLYMPRSRSFYTRARKAGFDGPIIISAPYGAHSARRELMAEAAFVTPIDPATLVSLIKDVIAEAIAKQRQSEELTGTDPLAPASG